MEAKQTNGISSICKVSTRCTPKNMIHHVKECLEDTYPPKTMIFHHGMEDLKSKSTSEQIADNTVSLATSVRSDGSCVIVSGLTIRTDKLNNKVTKVRSSPPEVFLGKGVLKICSKFTGKHPSRSVISISDFGIGVLL